MKPERVPFNRPLMVGRELEYVAEAVRLGHLAGDGPFTQRCQAWLESALRAPRVLLTHSCTAALEMSALLCAVEPGDEVVLPSFTFVSTANAFVLRGARPVFVDIREDTLNMDERLVENAISRRTRVIVPVHYAGVACEMDALTDIARRHGLRVVEDAAQAVGSCYRGRPLGAIGDLGALSFHETKNLISGEGGALVIRDEALLARAEVLRDKGTDRASFLRGEVDKYTWVDVGSSFLPSEIVAAFLLAQLERAEEIQSRRRRIHALYREALQDLEDEGRLRLPVVPEHCQHNGHVFYVLLRTVEERDALLDHFARADINAVFHYVPLHSSPMGRRLGCDRARLPVTEAVSGRLLRLPSFHGLEDSQQARVIEELRRWCGART